VNVVTENSKESSFVNLTQSIPPTLEVKSKNIQTEENSFDVRYTVR